MFLVAVGFWNFLGAGIFGFLVNLPIVSYYEIGTALTANHAHGAMMSMYSGPSDLPCSRCATSFRPERWPEDKLAKLCFWSLNLGLAWMMFATLLPLGVLQLLPLGVRWVLRGAFARLHHRPLKLATGVDAAPW